MQVDYGFTPKYVTVWQVDIWKYDWLDYKGTEMKVYWGDIHAHCGVIKGVGELFFGLFFCSCFLGWRVLKIFLL